MMAMVGGSTTLIPPDSPLLPSSQPTANSPGRIPDDSQWRSSHGPRAGQPYTHHLVPQAYHDIFVKSTYKPSEWIQRKECFDHALVTQSELIDLLCAHPPEDNGVLCRLLEILDHAASQSSSSQLKQLVPIYTSGEMPFFRFYNNLSVHEFLDWREAAKHADILARRESALHHLSRPNAPTTNSLSAPSTKEPPLYLPPSQQDSFARISNDSGYDTRHESFESLGSFTAVHTPNSADSPAIGQGPHASPGTNQPTSQSVQRNVQTKARQRKAGARPPVQPDERILCPYCDHEGWLRDKPRALDHWRHHMLTKHGNQVTWTCTHRDCQKNGTGLAAYWTHHHPQHHRECTENPCLQQPHVDRTGKVLTTSICFLCDDETPGRYGLKLFEQMGPGAPASEQDDDCWKQLIAHYETTHSDLLWKNNLVASPFVIGSKLGHFICRSPELLKELTLQWSSRYGPQAVDLVWAHLPTRTMQKLAEDIQSEVQGTSQERAARIKRVIGSFIDNGSRHMPKTLPVSATTTQSHPYQTNHPQARAITYRPPSKSPPPNRQFYSARAEYTNNDNSGPGTNLFPIHATSNYNQAELASNSNRMSCIGDRAYNARNGV